MVTHTHIETHSKKKSHKDNTGLAHIHPSGHQPTTYHAKQQLNHNTVTATNQPPTARPKRIKHQPNQTASTQPTAKQFEISLHTHKPNPNHTPPTSKGASNQTTSRCKNRGPWRNVQGACQLTPYTQWLWT